MDSESTTVEHEEGVARRRYVIIMLVVLVAAAGVFLCVPSASSGHSAIVVKPYRFNRAASPGDISSVMNEIPRLFRSPVAELLRSLFRMDRPEKTCELLAYPQERKVVFVGPAWQHERVRHFLGAEYRHLLRPEELYEIDDVADVDTFADNCGSIARDVFTEVNYSFLTAEDIEFIADALAAFVKTYTRADVPKATQLHVLEALDAYLYSTFHSPVHLQERTYLRLDDMLKTLKMKLWQVIARPPLTPEEEDRFQRQKQWLHEFVETRYADKTQLERVTAMYRAHRVFEDVLNGFSMEPMSDALFADLQAEVRKSGNLAEVACTVSCWSTNIFQERDRANRKQNKAWEYPFGTVTGYSGGSDRLDFAFESEKPHLLQSVLLYKGTRRNIRRHVYDISAGREFALDDDCITGAEIEAWTSRQARGHIYYDAQSNELVACRGAKMAVLDTDNWIDADRITTEHLHETVRTAPITRFSLTGLSRLSDPETTKQTAPVLAAQTEAGEIVLIRAYDPTSKPGLSMQVRKRFEGSQTLWSETFITGKRK